LAIAICKETSGFPKEERYELTSQIRRAGISIPSNIAEGEGRHARKFRRFLQISLGSLKELETQLLIADELRYLEHEKTAERLRMAAEAGRLTHRLTRALKTNG
jgi:four helix bundle protein